MAEREEGWRERGEGRREGEREGGEREMGWGGGGGLEKVE